MKRMIHQPAPAERKIKFLKFMPFCFLSFAFSLLLSVDVRSQDICNGTPLPGVHFPLAVAKNTHLSTSRPTARSTKSGIAHLSKHAKSVLDSVSRLIKDNPNCKVKVVGYGETSKLEQQVSWDRTNAVIRYLVEKRGISEDRFIFSYGGDGDPGNVDLSFTNEEGPNTVPAPHPDLRQK